MEEFVKINCGSHLPQNQLRSFVKESPSNPIIESGSLQKVCKLSKKQTFQARTKIMINRDEVQYWRRPL